MSIRLAKASASQRIPLFLTCLLLLWLPIALPIYRWVVNPNQQSLWAMGLLYAEFLLLVYAWSKKIDRILDICQHYGVKLTRQNRLEFLAGLCIGIAGLLALFTTEELLGWLSWHHSPRFLPQVLLEAALIGLAVGCAEELFFRGWFLTELQRDYSPKNAAWTNAFIFALLHFIKPFEEIIRTWVQFPGLLGLGLTLVWSKYTTNGRLGLSMGLHTGLVGTFYAVNVGQLIAYTQTVPSWITGIDGNPLAGMVGLMFLGLIGVWVRKRARDRPK